MKGVLLLLLAAFQFASSTVFVKGATAGYGVAPAVTSFARFFAGLLIFSAVALVKKDSLRPNNTLLVVLRAVLNVGAVLLLYAGIRYTTVTKANLLNLTYPAFIFLVAPYINREPRRWHQLGFLAMTLAGAWLVVAPPGGFGGAAGVNVGDLLALASGLVAAFAISVLRQARKYDRASLIMFHVMFLGTVVSGLVMLPSFEMPRGGGLCCTLAAALLAVGGQFALTFGYRYIKAVIGSIVMESGILFAAVLGTMVLGEPITARIVTGGTLILLSIVGVSGVAGALWRRRLPRARG